MGAIAIRQAEQASAERIRTDILLPPLDTAFADWSSQPHFARLALTTI
jgi:hypothetical protein